ncbi:MAG: adenosylcobinamide-GDP ribazoletransferase [Paracoccaceae bacterium]
MPSKSDMFPLRLVDVHLAVILLTRLPVPHLSTAAFHRSAVAVWAYPIVGLVLALAACAAWTLAEMGGLPETVQAGLVLGLMILFTGALHEDGLADSADGLWGGNDPERRLEIMKDSRIGSYGVIALIFGIGLRWSTLIAAGPWGFVAAATLSRAVLPWMMAKGPYARPNGLAKSVGVPSSAMAWLAFGLGAGTAILCLGPLIGFAATGAAALCCVCLRKLARRKLDGVTGDILGATQNLSEIAVLIVVAANLS